MTAHENAPESAATGERVQRALEGTEFEWAVARDGMPTVATAREAVHDVLRRLRDAACFEIVTLVTAIDHLHDEEDADTRFELVWQLHSIENNDRVRVLVRVPESAPEAPTCTDLWPGAAYFERECFDLLGVRFTGHAHLKRLLMPEGYDHHPLRKDFPHQGIQPDRLYREWDRERRAAYAENERDGEATR